LVNIDQRLEILSDVLANVDRCLVNVD